MMEGVRTIRRGRGEKPESGAKAAAEHTASKSKSASPRRPKRLSSVATAIALLKCFSAEEVEIGVSGLARKLGVAKSTGIFFS